MLMAEFNYSRSNIPPPELAMLLLKVFSDKISKGIRVFPESKKIAPP